MPTKPTFVYLLWDKTQQKSVVNSSSVLGEPVIGTKMMAKWKGKLHDVTIVAVGMRSILVSNYDKCDTSLQCREGQKDVSAENE